MGLHLAAHHDRADGRCAGAAAAILLQAKDDPSVLVPAAEVWRSNGDGVRIPGRQIVDAQERLLGGLGHALRDWPELEAALREPAPDGVDLDTDAAMAFVRDVAGALEQGGFSVLVPSWWRQRLRVSLRAEPMGEIEEGSGLFSLDGLCRFEWQVAVGDQRLTVAELRELAALKLPVVMSRGQWIVLAPEDVEAALAFLSRRDERGRAPAAEILRTGLGLDMPANADIGVEVDARGWLAALMDAAQDDRGLRLIGAAHVRGRATSRISNVACRGWRSCRGSAWAPVWPTTWAWVRPCSCSRCCSPSVKHGPPPGGAGSPRPF